MRSLKFRVWSKKDKSFVHEWQIAEIKNADANNGLVGFKAKAYFDANLLLITPNTFHVDNVEINQFTGLLDKEGAEIYEGDILKVSRSHTKSVETSKNVFKVELIEDGEEIGHVFWADYAYEYAISYEHIRYDDVEKLQPANHRYLVIGNIYENPELINETA